MNYFYDILLNMDEESNYKFYEWDSIDPIELVKKIPLFRVDSKTLNDFYIYNIKVSNDFLNNLLDKTFLKNDKLNKTIKYACLLSDTKSSIAVEFDNNGYVISISELLLDDDININEIIYTCKETSIDYEKQNIRKITNKLRQEEMIKKIIKIEINTLIDNNMIEKLQYLFYEWFSYIEEDKDNIKIKIDKELKKDIDSNMQHIYDIIKLSYHKV